MGKSDFIFRFRVRNWSVYNRAPVGRGNLTLWIDQQTPVPDYTTVSRRQGGLALKLGPAPACEPRHVVIDATGLKAFGAGE